MANASRFPHRRNVIQCEYRFFVVVGGAYNQEEFSSRTDAKRTCFRRWKVLRPAELGLTRKPALTCYSPGFQHLAVGPSIPGSTNPG